MEVKPQTGRMVCFNRQFLFLQGPLSSFYSKIAQHIIDCGGRVLKIHFCGNDVMDWHHKGAFHFTKRPDNWKDFLEEFLLRYGVTDIVFHGDRRFYHRIAGILARKHNITVFATELGYLRPDWMTIERGACSTNSHFPNDPCQISQIAKQVGTYSKEIIYPSSNFHLVTQELKFTFFNSLWWGRFPHYRNHRLESRFEVYSGWLATKFTSKLRSYASIRALEALWASGVSYYVFAMQLDGDFQLRDHSPFKNMSEALEYTARSFAKFAPQDSKLVIKTHPLEFRHQQISKTIIKTSQRYGLQDRLMRVDEGNLVKLSGASRGFVTVNSSAGMEALEAGCPTYSVMPTVYDVRGLTFQGTLDAFWKEGQKPDPILYQSLCRALAGTIQVRGTLYNRKGLQAAAEAVAEKLMKNTVNTPDAFVSTPPRWKKAAHMGVFYDFESEAPQTIKESQN